MSSEGVLEYDSGVCCFKEIKTTAKILIILAFFLNQKYIKIQINREINIIFD